MKIKFIENFPLEKSLVFESIYPENLQFELGDKQDLKNSGATFITMIDEESGEPIGESYYLELDLMEDWEEDEHQKEDGLGNWYGKKCAYIYSTTILPPYQGKRYGAILKSFVLGRIKKEGYDFVLGHARENGSIQLNEFFGGKREEKFEDWYKTGETYFLYSIKL